VTKSAQDGIQRAIRQRSVFYRWLWLVYAPLVLGLVAIVVILAGAMPGFVALPVVALLAWDAGAARMLVERHRRKVRLPIPKTLLIGLGALVLAVGTGVVLAWMGVDRLSSSSGPPMLVLGGFLILSAAFAPAFKVMDLTLRLAGRTMWRMGQHVDRRRPQPVRGSRPRPRSRKAA